MTTYTLKCKNCKITMVESNRKFGDNEPPNCLRCDHKMKQVIDRTEFKLKGEGWYKPSHYD